MEELSLKEIQNASLKVLKELVRVIDQLNLDYSLAWGTLLGAVRHGGYIPWDDDIDIMMPREDYQKLILYCKNHESDLHPYRLMNIVTNPGYVYAITRFCDTRYKIDYENVRDYGLGIFVDIYAIDGLGNSYSEAKRNMKRNFCLRRLAKLVEMDHFIPSPNGIIKSIFKLPPYFIAKMYGREKMIKKWDNNCRKIKFTSSAYVGIPTAEISENYIMKREWFDEYTTVKFENGEYRAVTNYDMLLKHCYGNYMKLPPKDKQIPHHFYKVYKKGD